MYNYLLYVGFTIPIVDGAAYRFDRNNINVLVLGIEKLSDLDRKDNTQFIRRFALHVIDIDTKVKDIGAESFTGWNICTYTSWSGVCNDKKSWSHKVQIHSLNEKVHELFIGDEYSCNWSDWSVRGAGMRCPYFISLNGLSVSSNSGTISRSSLNTKW